MPDSTFSTRSRLPFIAIGVGAAVLATVVAAALMFGGRADAGGNAFRLVAAGAPAAVNFAVPLAADPSASPNAAASTAPGKTTDNEGCRRGPGGLASGHEGGGPGEPGRGHGPISITAINGSQLSLKTDDGWTRTIDASGATVSEPAGTAITLADLNVGDQVGFSQTRNADGSYKITAVVRIPPHAGGTVRSVDASSATLMLPDGTTKTIGLTSATTYILQGQAATAADLRVGARVHVVGSLDGSGNFTATRVDIAPAEVQGIVTARTSSTITITDRAGATVVVNVDASTTYHSRGDNAASLADVAAGDFLEAEGSLNSDGSITANRVHFGTAGPCGCGGPGDGNGGNGFGPRGPGHGFGCHDGHRFGGHDGHGFGHGPGDPANPADPGNPNASPAPSPGAG